MERRKRRRRKKRRLVQRTITFGQSRCSGETGERRATVRTHTHAQACARGEKILFKQKKNVEENYSLSLCLAGGRAGM